MTKKVYLAYPVTAEWRAEVRAELKGRPRGTQERLREFIQSRGVKCSSGELAEILGGKYETSEIVEPVHEFFKWEPPMPPTASRDAAELAHGYLRLTQQQRELVDKAVDIVRGDSGEQAKKTLTELLKLLQPPDKE